MGKEKLRQRNHTVQKALLRRFASNTGHLACVPLSGTKRFVSVNNATVINNFYSTRRPDGSLDDSFERSRELHRVEGPLTTLLKRLIDDQEWPIRPDDRVALARWIGLQMVRTPAMRSLDGDLRDMVLRNTIGLRKPADLAGYFAERGRHIAAEHWEELWEIYVDGRGATNDGDAGFHIEVMRQFEPAFTATVQERGWTLIRCNAGLITTDHPVATRMRTKPTADNQLFGIPGEIIVALDRYSALIVGEDPHPDQRIDDSSAADVINRATVDFARTCVFHHPDDDPTARLMLPPPYRRTCGLQQWLDQVVAQGWPQV